jgi:hypothetical protein
MVLSGRSSTCCRQIGQGVGKSGITVLGRKVKQSAFFVFKPFLIRKHPKEFFNQMQFRGKACIKRKLQSFKYKTSILHLFSSLTGVSAEK